MDCKLWGSLTEDSSNFTSPYLLSFDEVERLSKDFVPPSLGKSAKNENVITTQLMPISYFEVDPIVLNNIQLVQYSKKLQELLFQVQNSYKKITNDIIPPIPIEMQKNLTQFDPTVKLTRKGTHQLLHKAVYTICAHEGFDSTTDIVLSTLVDVVDEMLIKFCKLLKTNTERDVLNQSTGFVDPLERTLYDVGVNGVKELHSFYANRILGYNNRLQLQARNLRQMCLNSSVKWDLNRTSNLSNPWEEHDSADSSCNETNEVDRILKSENSSSLIEIAPNNEAINQLHLEDNATVGPGLEPGLRMLYTLEQQEALSTGSQGLQYVTSEDGVSPGQYAGLEASPNILSSKKNGGKKRKKM